MKKLFALFLILGSLSIIRTEAQIPVYQNLTFVSSAPSGSCSLGSPVQTVISTGLLYSCQSGTWAAAAGSVSGTVGSGTANSLTCYSSTGTVVGACTGITTDGSGKLTVAQIVAPQISFSTPMDFGAKGNATSVSDAAMTNGSDTLTSASAPFNCTTDVGKAIVVIGAGPSAWGAGSALATTISACSSSSSVTLTAAAQQSVTGALVYFGTDDTAALRSCAATPHCTINNNKTFMISGNAAAIPVSGVVDGTGTLVFAPQGSGTNDRLFYAAGLSTNGVQMAAGAITKGATSITVNSAGDIASWTPGSLIILREVDANVGDVVYVEEARIASISGATITLAGNIGTTFPNARTFNNSGSPAACVAVRPCGLSAAEITSQPVGISLRNFTVIVPNLRANGGSTRVLGISAYLTRDMVIDGIRCTDASQNCFAGYDDVGLRFSNNSIADASQDEFAAEINPSVMGNQFNSQGFAGPLFSSTSPAAVGGPELDLGTVGAVMSGNIVGTCNGSGFPLLHGVHNSVITQNICQTMTGPATFVNVIGGYANAITDNILLSTSGTPAVGLQFVDDTTATVTIYSDSNSFSGNQLPSTVSALYVLSGTHNTDTGTSFNGLALNAFGGLQHSGNALTLATDISDFTPQTTYAVTATNLTTTGASPTITGHYSVVGSTGMVFFWIDITTTGTTASTANSTYFTLPTSVSGTCNGSATATDNFISNYGVGCNGPGSHVFAPSWAATGHEVSLSGWYFK